MSDTNATVVAPVEEKKLLTKRNFWCAAVGAFGRDFAYNLFTGNLLTFIIFTKTLNELQFTFVTAIIIVARIFDAFNDPIMGGIVVNTRTRFGKYRPWILAGGVTSSIVIIMLFSIPVDGWGFIGLLAVMYFLFSITYTMNDIPYWALIPHLARDTDDRNKLSAMTQLFVAAGQGLAIVLIPALTTSYSKYLGGSAISAYMWVSIISAVLFIGSTILTVLGVRDHTEVVKRAKDGLETKTAEVEEKLSIKDMFRTLKNNDQLLIAAIIMILYSIGTGVVGGGLLTTYIYFNFGYDGILTTVFGVFAGIANVIFILIFPTLMKKMGRTKLITLGGLCVVLGYVIILVVGLCVPVGDPLFVVPLLELKITLKYLLMAIPYGLSCLGATCYYNMMFLNMSNTVEYNEWRTGKREEGLIFSLRPFTAKFASALQQLLVSAVYLAVGVLTVTNGISDIEQDANQGTLVGDKDVLIAELLNSVPESQSIALLVCMCLIPIAFMVVAMLLYKKKFILNDEKYEQIKKEIAERKLLSGEESAELALDGGSASEEFLEVAVSDDTSDTEK